MKNLHYVYPRRGYLYVVFLLLLGVLSACGGTPTPDVEATAQAALEATQAAQPTNTPTPTNTPIPPTDTPTPTDTPIPPTDTPTPTNTPVPPTDTPTPTDTPESPTDTPTPAPPTATPTPAISLAEEHFQKGLEYFEQEQWTEAIAEFEKAIQLDPEFAEAYIGLGYSYAYGPGNFEQAIEALEKYLQLAPDTPNLAEIEADIETMQNLVSQQPAGLPDLEVPLGKALFVFVNYSGETWIVDIGPHRLEVPANVPPKENTIATLALDPGAYTWQAHSMDTDSYITDRDGNIGFDFTVAAGEIYPISCCD